MGLPPGVGDTVTVPEFRVAEMGPPKKASGEEPNGLPAAKMLLDEPAVLAVNDWRKMVVVPGP
jgi:hypothetical protein